MSNSVYTFAELDFILQDDPNWVVTRRQLGLTYESSEGIRTAGAASLLARDLASVDGDDIAIPPEVSVPAQALARGGIQLVLAMADADQTAMSMLQFVPSEGPRVLFSPKAPGVFDLRLLSTELTKVELLVRLVVDVTPPGTTMGIAYGEAIVQVVRTDSGWATRTDESEQPQACDEKGLHDQIAAVFGPVLDGEGQ